MRDSLQSIQLWTYLLLVAVLCPLSAYFGWLWKWTPGAASMAILLIPTCMAAVSAGRGAASVVALLASVGTFCEVLIFNPTSSDRFELALPLLATCIMFTAVGIVSLVVENLRDRVGQLEEQASFYVRELYHRDREESNEEPPACGQICPTGVAAKPDAPDAINFAMLLLTLQDIGRRVSSKLDMDSLVPTIISASKASLKCDSCQLYFWNPSNRTLTQASDPRGREQARYIPSPDKGMAGWVIEHRQILTRHAVETDYNLQVLLEQDPQMPDAIAPLAVGGELLGLLVVENVEQDSNTFVRMLYILANTYALGIKNAQLFQRIETMARTDGLTGLLNHVTFQHTLQDLAGEPPEKLSVLSVIMSDIDHFKRFNDTYGHQAGDYVLCDVARVWKAVLPDHAILARYGGEEFICVLPRDDAARAWELADMLRRQIESHTFDFEGQQLQVTASFGVADNREIKTPRELIKLADNALYQAKEAGRNRVLCAPEQNQAVHSA